MTLKHSNQRHASLPSIGTIFNVCCFLVLSFNLIQNHFFFHESAIRQSTTNADGNNFPPNLRGGTSSDAISSAISMNIPRGKAVAMPSVQISADEEVERHIYGGKGDKAHLGGFTEFDVRQENN
jgi:hypothetical protein